MKIIIIGSGITGLSAAYFLRKKGHEVKIFEKSFEIGGLAGFFRINDSYLEKYYHHSFAGHVHLMTLLKELNIDNRYFSRSAKTGLYYENHIYPFVTAKDLISFKPLKLRNRIRLGLSSLLMMRLNDWKKLEKQTAIRWLRCSSGDEACKIIWEPLLKMKFGEDYDKISAAWLWNRVVDRKKAGGNKEVLGYIDGGYKTLLDALVSDIKIQGGEIITENPVEQINEKDGKCIGVKVNGEFFAGDIVVSTIPTPCFLTISPFLSSEYTETLKKIKYQGSVCLIIQLSRALSNYYWININDPNSPFVGVIEHTNFISPEDYGNKHIVYLTNYLSSDSEMFHIPDEKMYEIFISYLEKVFQDFKRQDVEQYWVFKDNFSQPIFVNNYSKIMPSIETPIKNLYLLNTAQMYPQSRSLNSSVALARQIENKITTGNEQ